MKNSNLHWINNCRALGILMIFFVHCASYYNYNIKNISLFIHPVYVNLFFFISGYLLFRKQLSEPVINESFRAFPCSSGQGLLENICFRLIIPSVLFSMLEFFPACIIKGQPFVMTEFLKKTIGGCTYWFTCALAVAQIIICIFLLLRRKTMLIYLLGGGIVACVGIFLIDNSFYVIQSDYSFPWQYREAFLSIPFLAFGGLYWKYEDLIDKMLDNKRTLVLLGAYLLLLYSNPQAFEVLISMDKMNLAGYGISLVGIVCMCSFCKKMGNCLFLLDYIGRNTLGLYFFSGAVPIVVSKLISKTVPFGFFGFAAVFLLSFAISNTAVLILKRYVPWVFDIRVRTRNKIE